MDIPNAFDRFCHLEFKLCFHSSLYSHRVNKPLFCVKPCLLLKCSYIKYNADTWYTAS